MYCKHCGKQVDKSAKICPNCGGNLKINSRLVNVQDEYITDSGSFNYTLWGLILPMVGLTLHFAWREDKPLSARAAMRGVVAFGAILMLFIVALSFVIIL